MSDDVTKVDESVGEPSAEVESAPPAEKKIEDDVIEKIEPQTEPIEVTLSFAGEDRVYIQKPLTYFNKIAFFGLVGRTIEEAMEGPDGLNVDALFGGGQIPTTIDGLTESDVLGLNGFLEAISKIAAYAPDFLRECYLMWLNVPRDERPWAWAALNEVDDEIGMQIIETFVSQNLKELEAFFTSRIPRLVQVVQKLRA